MIAELGVFAFLQMTILPGWLLTRRGRFESGIEKGAVVLVASLLFNYFIVGLLTAVHQYRQRSLVAIVIIELILLARQFWLQRQAVADSAPGPPRHDEAGEYSEKGPVLLALGVSLATLGVAAWEWVQELGKVFESYDAIASWNRWALEWSANRWPGLTWSYPQLLPANWSLAYVLAGAKEGEMSARGLMGVFPVLVLLAIFDLQRRLRQPWLALSALAAWILMTRTQEFLFDGYADAAVAALGFAGIYFLFLAREGSHSKSSLLAAAACFGAACVTKQAGLCLTAGTLAWMCTDARLRDAARAGGRTTKVALGLLLVCALHWYVIHYVISVFHLSTAEDEDGHLIRVLTVNMHQGRDLPQRISHGFGMIGAHLQPVWLYGVMGMLLLAALATPRGARLMLCFVVPCLLVWLLAFSYDIRNLAMAVPPAALAMGFGAAQLATWGTHVFARCRPPDWLCRRGLTILIATSVVAAALVSESSIRTHYLKARRHAGSFRLNREIAGHAGRNGTILTSYLQLRIQPGFSKRAVYFAYPLREDAELQSRLRSHPWIVVEESLPAADEAVRGRLLKNGTLLELTREGGFVLYRNGSAKDAGRDADGQR